MPSATTRTFGQLLRALLRPLIRRARLRVPARLRAAPVSVSLMAHAALLVVLGLLVIWHEMGTARTGYAAAVCRGFRPRTVCRRDQHAGDGAARRRAGRRRGRPRGNAVAGRPEHPAPLPNLLAGPGQREPTSGPQKFTSFDSSGVDRLAGRRRVRRPHQTARARLVGQRGGTPASEDAVARGLAWIAAHQRPNGSWWFDHRDGPCGGLCRDPGTVGSTTAATGLALLPFLGAGEIGEGSQYKKVVDDGLYYLRSRILVTPLGGDLQEGTMYAQGIAAIALCEAYAMTRDESLRPAAQLAIDFICRAQHEAGGWRYFPGQPGDTTVLGWQLMALKSARLAGLEVPVGRFPPGRAVPGQRAERRRGRVRLPEAGQDADADRRGPAVADVPGLAREDSRLARGVAYLEKLGPSRTDMYFNYYATQVLHHYEGQGWDAWNTALRDRLVATQSRRGHEHGSWYFHDEHGKSGGRLYTTAMCVMILEVYYRYMPLYGKRAVEEDL